MYVKFLLACSVVSMTICASAQDFSQVMKFNTPPPPGAAGLGKYGDIPVSEYTGIPSITIPLYELKGRDLTLPISLSYHASGLKVDEISSFVGAGWSLNAGGAITRSINGLTDFKSKRGPSLERHGIARPLAYDHNDNQIGGRRIPKKISSHCTLTWEDNTVDENILNYGFIGEILFEKHVDTEPDMFYYNFGGLSGKFFFDENRNIRLNQPVKLDINFPSEDSGTWGITTLDGTGYLFGGEENDEESWIEWTRSLYSGSSENKSYIQASTWYLKTMASPSGERINFKYHREYYEYNIFSGGAAHVFDFSCGGSGACSTPPISYGRPTKIENQGLFLKEIELVHADGSASIVRFQLAHDRQDGTINPAIWSNPTSDHPVTTRLDIIQVIEKTALGVEQVMKEFRLTQETGTNKLWLTKIQEVGMYNGEESKPPYTFEYYNHDLFPNRNSKAIDLWGFYNGADRNTGYVPYIAYDKFGNIHQRALGNYNAPSERYVKYGMLTKINYPTGGFTEFEYESNRSKGFLVRKLKEPVRVCRAISHSIPCDDYVGQSEDFSVATTTNYELEVEIDRPTTTRELAKVCRRYSGGFSSSCQNVFEYQKDFTVRTGTSTTTLEYGITGPNAGQAANSLLIRKGANTIEISISKGYPSSGTINLDLEPGDYTITASVTAQSTHEVWGRVTSTGFTTANPGYIVRIDKAGTMVQEFRQSGTYSLSLAAGDYTLKTVQADRGVAGDKASASLRNTDEPYIDSNVTAGVRIKRVRTSDGMNENAIVKRYEYLDSMGEVSGKLMKRPVTFFKNTFLRSSEFGEFCIYDTYSANSAYPLSTSAAGNFVGYSFVTVYNGEEGEFGKSTLTFNNVGDDQANNDPRVNFGCPGGGGSVGGIVVPGVPSLSNAYQNGYLKERIDYANENGTFRQVKKTVNTYTLKFFDTHGLKITSLPKPPSFTDLFRWVELTPCAPVAYKYYKIRVGYSRLKKSVETYYSDSGHEYAVEKQYGFNSQNHLLSWKHIKNIPPVYTSYSYYPGTDRIQQEKKSLNHQTVSPFMGRAWEYDNYVPTVAYVHERLKEGEISSPDLDLGSGANYKKRGSYTYNTLNNMLTQEIDSFYTSFVWNARGTDILARIENAVYDASGNLVDGKGNSFSSSQVNTLSTFTGTIDQFLVKFQQLREALPGAIITAYTYENGIGLTSQTDTNGLTSYYSYDPLGRLTSVKDSNEDITTSYRYNYDQ